jgi:hypothetical protein
LAPAARAQAPAPKERTLKVEVRGREGPVALEVKKTKSKGTETLVMSARRGDLSSKLVAKVTSQDADIHVTEGEQTLHLTLRLTKTPHVAQLSVSENGRPAEEYRVNLQTLQKTRDLNKSIVGGAQKKLALGSNLQLRLSKKELGKELRKNPKYRAFMAEEAEEEKGSGEIPWYCIVCYTIPFWGVLCLISRTCRGDDDDEDD